VEDTQLLTKDEKIYNFFAKINLKKNIINILPDDIRNLDLNPDTDHFIFKILGLFEKTETSKEDLINQMIEDYEYRYEAVFFKICLLLNQLQSGKGSQETKQKILNTLIDSNENLLMSRYIKPNENEFVFTANSLLKLHGAIIDDYEQYSYEDVNLYFLLQTHLAAKEYGLAIKNLEILFERENYFNNKSLFLYYFGKAIGLYISSDIHFDNTDEINKLFSQKKNETFHKICNILNSYITISSSIKKKGKIFGHLAKKSPNFLNRCR